MSTTVQLVLSEDVPHLGRMGDVVSVRAGYARNYLIPRKLAVSATLRNVKQLDHEKRVIAKRVEKRMDEAKSIAQRLEGVSLTISRRVTEEEKLYGSVNEKDIREALKNEGFDIEKSKIALETPIKNLGVFNVTIGLAADISAAIKVWVVAAED